MLVRLNKFFITPILIFSLVFIGGSSRVIISELQQLLTGSGKIVDLLYLASQSTNVVDNFGMSAKVAEAAEDPAEIEFHLSVGPVNGVATSNYVYGALFNPSGSGKAISVKRLMVRSNSIAAANYINLSVRRIVASSGGTQITSADIPKKNSESAVSVAEVRHTGPTVTFAGTVDSRLLGQAMSGNAGYEYSFSDIAFGTDDEKIILQPGEGIAVYQEAAGNTNQKITTLFEWEELYDTPVAQEEYMMALPRVEVAATANYVYNSLFNPSGSGKTAIVKRVWFGSETCDTTAVYTNNLSIKRISAASAGTQVTAANIPKKNTSSNDSAMEIRRTGVTVTNVGGADARLLHVTPCAAAGQGQGWNAYNIQAQDEKIILQPGEGIALSSETAGDIDQIVRMFVEWEEVSSGSTPSAGSEYIWSSNRVEATTAALGTTYYTLLNPAASGRTAVVKRLVIKVNADAAATYSTFNFQRISAASGGTSVAAADIPKKHTGSGNSVMEIKWCGAACASAITTTYVGSRSIAASGLSDSGILKALGPGAVGQIHGQKELVFIPNEPLVLAEGEGLGFYLNYLAGDVDQYVKISVEWGEQATAPTVANRYAIDIGAMPGNAGASYNYATFFNPTGSGKVAIVKQTALRVNAIAAASYSPIQIKRISAASGGTQITAANIPKKDSAAANSAVEIRRTGVTATYSQGVDGQLLAIQTPGTTAAAASLAQNGWRELSFENDEEIVLQPGEGIVLNNNAAADADHRIYWYLEWEEVLTASTPVAEESHLITIGPVNGSLTDDYVYATLYNPPTSNHRYIVSRVGIRSDRNGTAVAPTYIPMTVRKITAASGGTLITTADIPEQNNNSTSSTAEIRKDGVSTTFDMAISSRILNVVAPGVVRQSVGVLESSIVSGDEIVLQPGEGLGLYQESAAGDVLIRHSMTLMWREVEIPTPPYISFSISDNSVGFGNLSSVSARYASGDGLGTGTIYTTAHSISVTSNAVGGYVMTLGGNTLTSGPNTISAIGPTALSPAVGSNQFGVAASVLSGSGNVSSPYSTTNFYALDSAAFPDVIATGAGDEVETIYNLSYVANIAALTSAGNYSATLNYVVTGTF